MLRILLVEDDPGRERRLRSMLPADVRTVVARSAGAAIGVLAHDPGRVYAGVILDHDLQQRAMTDADRLLSGQDVVNAIVQHVDRAVPILIHSMNTTQRGVMAAILERAGYEVTTIPASVLDSSALSRWLNSVRENQDE